MMCFSVRPHKACPVNSKDHMKVLHAYIVKDLIDSSLQKRRIDRKNRDHSSKSQPCRKGYRMLFRNPHVKKTLREFLPEPVQSGPIGHGSRNGNYFPVLLCHRTYCAGKTVRICGRCFFCKRSAAFDLKRTGSMKTLRMGRCRSITSALFRKDMDNHRSLHSFCLIKKLHHLTHIMAVYWPQISQTHIFKKHSGNDQLLNTALGFADRIHHGSSNMWNFFERFCHADFHSRVSLRCTQGT